MTANLDDLLAQMAQNADVLNGWDLVFNMLIDPVDRFFQLQFDDQAPGVWRTVDTTWCQVVPNPDGPGSIAVYTDVQATLAQPQLTFVADRQNMARIAFTCGGVIRTASAAVPDGFQPSQCNAADPTLRWTSTSLAGASMVATVPLAVVAGEVSGAGAGYQVVLDFPSGSFSFPTVTQGDPDQLSQQVRDWFARNDVQYVLNRLSTGSSAPPPLAPQSFRINTVQTNSGRSILQFFVSTTHPAPESLLVNVNEPVPDGVQFTFMVGLGVLSQLGQSAIAQAVAFAGQNFIFPVPGVTEVTGIYPVQSENLLLTGEFELGDRVAAAAGSGQQVVRTGTEVPQGIAVFGPLTASVVDVLGQPAAGVPVVFSAGRAPDGMAVQIGEPSLTVTTDAHGMAATSPGDVRAYYAEGPFQVLATVPGGSSAAFDLVVAPTPPPPQYPGATVTVVGGDAQAVARTGQEVGGGIATFAPLPVVVRDAQGAPLPNVQVGWAPGSAPSGMAVQLDPSGASGVTTQTDATGATALGFVEGYYAVGPFTVVASVAGGGSATFRLSVAPTPPPPDHPGATVTVVSGDHQSVARTGYDPPGGTATFGPLRVLVQDATGAVLPGATVAWAGHSSPSMAVQLDPSGSTDVSTTTAPDGTTTLGSLCAYYAQGPFTVTATVQGGGSTTFSLVVASTPPPPSFPGTTVLVVSGDGQRAARSGNTIPGGTAELGPLQVQVRDDHGNPAPGIPVTWTATGPNAGEVQLDPSGAGAPTVPTDANGMAVLGKMGQDVSAVVYGAGTFHVTASVNGGGSKTFSMVVT